MSFIDITTLSLLSRIGKGVINGPRKIKALFLIALIFILSAIIITTLVESLIIQRFFNIVAGVLGGIGALCILVIYAYQTNLEETEARAEIKKVEDRVKEHPNEPTAAWDLARIKLENYLNRNLTQIQWIFVWTVIVMIAGFCIIGYGIVKAYEPQTKITASVVTAASGVIVEFIGATFLIIYKSTMQQAKDYVTVLERINAVGMSVQILESISKEEIKLQDSTKADLAKKLLELYGGLKLS
jgi:hypothetical protein